MAKASVRGITRNLRWGSYTPWISGGSNSPSQTNMLTFRVEQVDAEGNIIKYTAIEVTGTKIPIAIEEGDEVEVSGKLKNSGTLDAKRISNLKTGQNISKGWRGWS